MTRLTPTEPVLMSKPLGETNIPDPASFSIQDKTSSCVFLFEIKVKEINNTTLQLWIQKQITYVSTLIYLNTNWFFFEIFVFFRIWFYLFFLALKVFFAFLILFIFIWNYLCIFWGVILRQLKQRDLCRIFLCR